MGVYDVSSELKLIRKKTNRSKVIYFGHSLGSNIGLIYSSVKPEEASNYLKSMILLAPPAFFGHGTSLIYIFKDFAPLIQVSLAPITSNFIELFLGFYGSFVCRKSFFNTANSITNFKNFFTFVSYFFVCW